MKLNISNIPREILVGATICLILILIIVGYNFYSPKLKEEVQDQEFLGTMINMEDDTITLQGNFASELAVVEKPALRSFTFRVDEKTVFKKISTRLPSLEDIRNEVAEKASGSFRISPTEESGSAADLNNLLSQEDTIYVKADFTSSVTAPNVPIASFISYHILIDSAKE